MPLSVKTINELIDANICPDCGNKLVHRNGCVECVVCGWSLCK